MLDSLLLDQTRARFPDFSSGEIELTALEKGGSDRKFYRVETGAERSIILVKYNVQKEENRHYVEQAQFLADHGVNVPEIYHHDAAEGLIWMQDLGEIDLWASREEPWPRRREEYYRAVEQAARLHALPLAEARKLALQPAFDERLYLWEQEYFFENCLERHFRVPSKRIDAPALVEMAQRLASLPRVLVHRDFQSQNVMWNAGDAWLIDFQGMRPGLRQYDLASLLYDPYVDLAEDERADILLYYERISGIDEPDLREVFHLCGAQRLMQALGAYGFLGYVKGRREFLRHIPQALRSLRGVVAELPQLVELRRVLAILQA